MLNKKKVRNKINDICTFECVYYSLIIVKKFFSIRTNNVIHFKSYAKKVMQIILFPFHEK